MTKPPVPKMPKPRKQARPAEPFPVDAPCSESRLWLTREAPAPAVAAVDAAPRAGDFVTMPAARLRTSDGRTPGPRDEGCLVFVNDIPIGLVTR